MSACGFEWRFGGLVVWVGGWVGAVFGRERGGGWAFEAMGGGMVRRRLEGEATVGQ